MAAQVPGQQPLPGIGRRLSAMAYDAVLLVGVLAITFLLPNAVIAAALGRTPPNWVLVSHVFLVLLAYFWWFWAHGGQTLAMKTWKIRLVSANGGGPPGNAQILVRYVLAWPSLLFYGAGVVWALFDRERQFLHDRLAGTRIEFAPTRG